MSVEEDKSSTVFYNNNKSHIIVYPCFGKEFQRDGADT